MNSIIFAGEDYRRLRNQLFASAPLESAAVLLAGRVNLGGRVRLLVREVVPVPPSSYLVQERARLVLSPLFLAPLIKRARLEGWSVVLAHSHPFQEDVHFSEADDEGEAVLMPSIFQRAGNRAHGSLVVGRNSFRARIRQSPDLVQFADEIVEVGQSRMSYGDRSDGREVEVQFERNVRAFGSRGQHILSSLKFGIVGLGGTGSLVAEQLTYLGVRRFYLLDPDVVDETNLNRVVGASRTDISRSKVEVAARGIQGVDENAQISAKVGSVVKRSDAQPLLECDLIFCCTDSHGSRAVLNQLAYQYFIPTIDMGVRIDAHAEHVQTITGRVQMLSPGLPCLVCQSLLDPEEVRRDLLSSTERRQDPYIVGDVEPQPAVISINGTVSSLAVTMALSAVVGMNSVARHQIYRGVEGVVRRVEGQPTTGCVVCSLQGSFGRGDLWPLPWRLD